MHLRSLKGGFTLLVDQLFLSLPDLFFNFL